ncbi:MAG: hypothetical protein ACRDMV_15295 [Streptosporangiales bacterium]
MPDYDSVATKQNQLIRKALQGSVFVAPHTADPIAALSDATGLVALPTGYDDVGWTTDDGAQFSRDVSTSDVPAWGSVEPVRRDITSDVTTLQIACLETKKTTIGLYTGADMSTVTADSTTGEVQVDKPDRPATRLYRVLSLAVDLGDAGEIYVARFLPRASVTDFDTQSYTSGDTPVTWPVTMTGYNDSVEGYSERYIFGGPGWQALLTAAGFGA